MLGWIERVVPQPPAQNLPEESPAAPQPAKVPAGKASTGEAADRTQAVIKETEKKVEFAVAEDPAPASASVFESVGSSVLSWISQGLEKVVPQPAPAPGSLQALGKSFETSVDVPDQTEVQVLKDEDEDALEITPFDPEEDELDGCELEDGLGMGMESWAGARVLSWLVQGFERMVPQPEMPKRPEPELKKEQCSATAGGTKGTKTRVKPKDNIPGVVEPEVREGQPEPGTTTLLPRSLVGDSSSMFGWFVQGLEKVMPQPVPREKQDVQGAATTAFSPVEERGKGA